MRISDQLRGHVRAAGITAVAERVGVGAPAMSKFAAGRGGVSLEVLDRICELLGLELAKSGGSEEITLTTSARTTQVDFRNKNQQRVVGYATQPANHPYAKSIAMACDVCGCEHVANSCDAWQIRCPDETCATNQKRP